MIAKRTNARTAYHFRYRVTYRLPDINLTTEWLAETKYYIALHRKQGNKKAQKEIENYVFSQCMKMGGYCADLEIYCIEERPSNCWLSFWMEELQEGNRFGITYFNWMKIKTTV